MTNTIRKASFYHLQLVQWKHYGTDLQLTYCPIRLGDMAKNAYHLGTVYQQFGKQSTCLAQKVGLEAKLVVALCAS